MTIKMKLPQNPKPFIRLIILSAGVLILEVIHITFFKSFIPVDPKVALIFQGGILFVILGSLFLEDKFTVPGDALVNALAAFISLLTVYYLKPNFWNLIAIYSGLVFLAAAGCFCFGLPTDPNARFPVLSRILYRFAITFGKSNVIFSIVFLYGLFTFYGIQSPLTATLVLFWGFYLALWPLKVPHLIQFLFEGSKDKLKPIGNIFRVESPCLIRVSVVEDFNWDNSDGLIACLPNKDFRYVYPLYSQFREEGTIATGLLLGNAANQISGAIVGGVYKSDGAMVPQLEDLVLTHFKLNNKLKPLGLIIEGSAIGKVKFEVWDPTSCEEGMLVFCKIGDQYVYYQIIEGTTHEESIERDRHGFHVAQAIQLGILEKTGKFKKYHWVPSMNIPVFPATHLSGNVALCGTDGFEVGKIPKSNIKVFADLRSLRVYHTAILGVTGSGKSEFALDLIRRNAAKQVKVFCVDLTSVYVDKLQDLNPANLSLDPKTSEDLGLKIHEADTGEFGGGKEKKILKSFADQIRREVKNSVEGFIKDSTKFVGLINLPSISNTKATIFVTEIFLSSILHYAKDHKDSPGILIALEEAHTVIPESTTMGLGDNESKGMVARIAQIALQGRKYNVGLLVISQRTANVSKTVLSQCNTIFAFSSFDETGINYLANIIGRDFADTLPNLDFLQVVGFGKGMLSDRPVIFEIPYDPKKDDEKRTVQEVESHGSDVLISSDSREES